MSDNEIKGCVISLWIVAAILIFVANMHNVFFSDLAKRVDALEQQKKSETQR